MGELFCGPGGLALGAQMASESEIRSKDELFGIQHIWANDIDSDSCSTYKKNIRINPNWVVDADVKDFIKLDLPEIDAFAYGFPCNDFSVVGEKNGFHGEYGPLYTYGIKVIDRYQPKWFFAENVGGLTSANEGKAFKIILNALQNAGPGYRVVAHKYKFEEYGVPQRRHRIILIGTRKDLLLEFKVPAPITVKPEDQKTVRQALEDPPIPSWAKNQEKTKNSMKVIERLKYIPPGKNAWCEEVPEHLRLNVKKARLSQIYKRLDPDRPAYTVTGSGGGGTHMYHWEEPRALTNRERARIQTFPDVFEFLGTKEGVRKQIGMAVPPIGVQVIVEAVLKTFAGIPYESVPGKWDGVDSELEIDLGINTERAKQLSML